MGSESEKRAIHRKYSQPRLQPDYGSRVPNIVPRRRRRDVMTAPHDVDVASSWHDDTSAWRRHDMTMAPQDVDVASSWHDDTSAWRRHAMTMRRHGVVMT